MEFGMPSVQCASGNNPVQIPAPRRGRPSLRSLVLDKTCCNLPQLGRAWMLGVSLCVATATVTAAEVFKWKDADGHVHFGDRPPDSAAESVTIRSGAAAGANGSGQERLRQVLEGYTKEREAREASRTAALQEEARREQICARAKARQLSAERANFLFEYTPTGERRVLEGAEYKNVIDKARQAVADSCD